MTHPSLKQGILPSIQIAEFCRNGQIVLARERDPDQIQPASLDLRLGEKAYRVRASFLPGPRQTVAERLKGLVLHEMDLREGTVLETGCVYIVPLMESLALPSAATATIASSWPWPCCRFSPVGTRLASSPDHHWVPRLRIPLRSVSNALMSGRPGTKWRPLMLTPPARSMSAGKSVTPWYNTIRLCWV